MPDTYLSQAVDAVHDAGAAYDANAKYLLADKQVLARILKYAVSEFGDMEIPAIINGIGDNIEVGTKPVDPGLSVTGRVDAAATEDSAPGEGRIFFDIRFTAYRLEEEIKFLVNIEAQKSSSPAKLGYHLENRILFYLSRMVSAQKQTEFYHSDFDSLKRVRSIWICMDGGEDGDSIEEIGLCRKSVYGKKCGGYGMDLMKAVIIHIQSGKEGKTSRHELIAMLEVLFAEMPAQEKKRMLEEEFAMKMSVELERRIQIMCNLSEAIKEEATKNGMKAGIERGIKKERYAAIERMIRAGAAREQILSYGYTEDEYTEAERIWIEDQPAGQRVTVHYHTLYGNQPDANGNYIGLWPASGGTVPRRKAIWSEAVKNSSPDSSVAYLMPISEDGFIIGYCQAGDPKTDLDVSMNVSASALIDPVNSLAGGQDFAKLDITGGTSSAMVGYRLVKHMDCKGHWFGIWDQNKTIGIDKPMYADQMLQVDPDKSGYLNLSNVRFLRGTGYTFGYFIAGWKDAGDYDVTKLLAYIDFQF